MVFVIKTCAGRNALANGWKIMFLLCHKQRRERRRTQRMISVIERWRILSSFPHWKNQKTSARKQISTSKYPKICGNIIKLICTNLNMNWR